MSRPKAGTIAHLTDVGLGLDICQESANGFTVKALKAEAH